MRFYPATLTACLAAAATSFYASAFSPSLPAFVPSRVGRSALNSPVSSSVWPMFMSTATEEKKAETFE